MNAHICTYTLYNAVHFNSDVDLLNAFIEEKLEMFINNMKEFLSEPAVLAAMFRVLEIVAGVEGKYRDAIWLLFYFLSTIFFRP
jgi:hypothetical protein